MSEPDAPQESVSGARSHWEKVYGTRPVDEASWFQPTPTCSLELIDAVASPDAAVIDVGGGASTLVDELVRRGYEDLTVVDASATAIATARARLGSGGNAVTWIVADLLEWQPARRYAVWHDRAVFHFMVEESERDRYVERMRSAVAPGGAIVVATFAEDGPQTCSGLPTGRYDAAGLAAALGVDLEVVTTRHEQHVTPAGVVQPFTWVVLRA